MKMFLCRNQGENSHLPKVRWRSAYCHMAISLIHLSLVFIYFLCPLPALSAHIGAFMPYLPGRIEGGENSVVRVSAFTAAQVMNERVRKREVWWRCGCEGIYGHECSHPLQPRAPARSSRALCFPQVLSEKKSCRCPRTFWR